MPDDSGQFTPPDWRDAEQYRHLLELDRAGWAWEWLRRHAAYEGEACPANSVRRSAQDPKLDVIAVSSETVSSRWGLCFRRVCKLPCHPGAAAVGRAI